MKSLQQLLHNAFRMHAKRSAILDPASSSTMTYEDLYDLAARAAGFLQSQGVREGDYVVIALGRSIQYIVAEVACALFGFGSVLMDANYPKERIDYVNGDVDAKLVIDAALMDEMLAYPHRAEYREAAPDSPAVVIYTSGSTGRPKGIVHNQASVGGAVLRNHSLLHPTPNDVEGLVAPFTFIAGYMLTMHPLCAGGCLTIIPREVIVDPIRLADFIERTGVTCTYIPPKALKVFKPEGKTLRLVVTGSERVSGIGPREYRIVNIYGMSETCSGVTAFWIDKAYENTPIGRQMEGCAVYLLDGNGHRADEGEICAAGHFMTGYIGMPESTCEVKVANPFFKEDGFETMIRTGDVGRLDESGNLVYVNRKDWMVKINGQRVEPGEIEAVLKTVPGVADAAVKGFVSDREIAWLCAYYVKKGAVSEDDLRRAVTAKLPPYMMPAHFVELTAMPLNANGKLDRLALKAPDAARFAEDYVAPANEVEKRLCDAMACVLGLGRMGVNDDFFRVGGDSIACMTLVAQINDPRIGAGLVYRHRTPAAIARALEDMEVNREVLAAANREAMQRCWPLLQGQKLHMELQKLAPRSPFLNVPALWQLKPGVDLTRLRRALEHVIGMHHVLYVRLTEQDGCWRQQYCAAYKASVPVEDVTAGQLDALRSGGFDTLTGLGRLYDIRILRGGGANWLYWNLHHANCDGTGIQLLLDQLARCYMEDRPALNPDYYFEAVRRMAEKKRDAVAVAAAFGCYEAVMGKNAPRVRSIPLRKDMEGPLCAADCISEPRFARLGGGHDDAFFTAAILRAMARYNGSNEAMLYLIYNGRNDELWESTAGFAARFLPVSMKDPKVPLADIRHEIECLKEHPEIEDVIYPKDGFYDAIHFNHLGSLMEQGAIANLTDSYEDLRFFDIAPCLISIVLVNRPEGDWVDLNLYYSKNHYRGDSIGRFVQLIREEIDRLDGAR